MAYIEDQLVQAEHGLRVGHGEVPERILVDLIRQLSASELSAWELDIRRLVDRFQRKRRARLIALIDARMANANGPAADIVAVRDAEVPNLATELASFEETLRADLRVLSENHIFQWSTFYRDILAEYFQRTLEERAGDGFARILGRSLSEHANEIFTKGYEHVTLSLNFSHYQAIQKSVAGLSRFLDLAVEFYSARVSGVKSIDEGKRLRSVTSRFLFGILEGYGSARLGDDPGWNALPRFPRSWAHYVPFLVERDATILVEEIEQGEFASGLETVALPLIRGLDKLTADYRSHLAPLPAVAQLAWEQRRLEVALRPPVDADAGQLLEIAAFLNESFVTTAELQAAASRGASAVIAPLKPDVEEFVAGNAVLSRLVTPVRTSSAIDSVANALFLAVDDALYRQRSPRAAAEPITYNIAREFPLRNPFRAKYFHVPRSSVRDLLRASERRNGVRLWCSVRRSGKTTACFDLGTTTGVSTVVSQTCDSTDQFPDSHVFYDEVLRSIEQNKQLDNGFVERLVQQCAPVQAASATRYVFVIDEYETLFGRLRSALRVNPDLRYTVVQPLLNQMVAFTRDHLLVFMGQQPDAHYILMDQNQLSAYVEQDPFPLFAHDRGATTGEFAELVRKVLSERIAVDGGFLDELHGETAGHPFLTVNLLVEFVDWLIDSRRPARALHLRAHDVSDFISARLTSQRLKLSPEFDFFRAAIGEALSPLGATMNRWLHMIYRALREIVLQSPTTWRVTRDEFASLATDVLDVDHAGFSPEDLLRTGAQANFLAFDDSGVMPRIRVLGRLAKETRPRVT